ncbi:hypothetical protein F753_04075 [Stutzerimonas chloritidismutans AW-1]|uniref:Uncharacterized protein n=1 Tax=Stutzerimonas chloritidismutans AW-1 TaxID=1263865 RepID=V4S6N9_STUCH|nr:hypothetical protein [Stutzerimonas chloritidismutans]ESR00682.1 hypothetical protein F753_04075 [Stutzerimonas chloritidismutans AW-1]
METQGTYQVPTEYVRGACLRLFVDGWAAPTAPEVRQILKMAGLDPRSAGDFLGVSRRQVNRWTTAEEEIAYSSWVMLCQRAGIGYLSGPAAPAWRDEAARGTGEQVMLRLDLDMVNVVEVYGVPDMGWYEWRHLVNGARAGGSDSAGYGSVAAALRDALNALA